MRQLTLRDYLTQRFGLSAAWFGPDQHGTPCIKIAPVEGKICFTPHSFAASAWKRLIGQRRHIWFPEAFESGQQILISAELRDIVEAHSDDARHAALILDGFSSATNQSYLDRWMEIAEVDGHFAPTGLLGSEARGIRVRAGKRQPAQTLDWTLFTFCDLVWVSG
ncbi:MAG: hypothetical protein AAFY02_09855 [Pseudomonadota bacterium]